MADPSIFAIPEWSEYRKKNGLDPLGMQNSAVNLYQALLPGISNVTNRIRYYGLYAWLSMAYAKHNGDTNPKTWQRFIRRSEALFALISQLKNNETGVAGANWANHKLYSAGDDVIQFDVDAEPGSETHYLKQPWGAYGAAYASQLFEIGVFSRAEGHDIPVPSQIIGDKIAELFAAEVGESADTFLKIVQKGKVTKAELTLLSNIAPSEIAIESSERTIYQDLLFSNAGLERNSDVSRKHTLQLILCLASQMGNLPSSDEVRWALYADHLADDTLLTWPSQQLEKHRKRWWLYQANDLTHICFETLLKFTLDKLESHGDGIPLSGLIAEITESILDETSTKPDCWDSYLRIITPETNAYSNSVNQSEFNLTQRLMTATKVEGLCTGEEAALALKLLAILHIRVTESEDVVKSELAHLDHDAFRSVFTETQFLNNHRHDDFKSFIGCLIEERVIRRHLWVALRKFRYQGDYTFLLETDDGRVRLRSKDGPAYTTPRLGPAITFLRDIHLLDDAGITNLGKKLLELI